MITLSSGLTRYFARDYESAVLDLEALVKQDARFGMAHYFLGRTWTELGAHEKAVHALETANGLLGASNEAVAALALAHARAGHAGAAREGVSELDRRSDGRYVSPAQAAQVLIGLGDTPGALDRLERARELRSADLAWIGVGPTYDAVRGEPRFARLLTDVGLAPFQRPPA